MNNVPPVALPPPPTAVMERLVDGETSPGWWQRLVSGFQRQPQFLPPGVYESGPQEVRNARLLAVFLAATVVFSLIPLAWRGHWNLATAPGWARAVLLLAAMQAVYIVWLVNMPDWGTLWFVMLVFAGSTMAYAMTMAMAMAWPVERPMLLGMQDVRYTAGKWCGAMVLVQMLATYLCGRISTLWHRRFVREIKRQTARMAEKGNRR
jgi:hypothetical protein